MARKSPDHELDWFPLYPDRLLESEAVKRMSHVGFAGYMRLLARGANRPDPGVWPDDDRLLAHDSGLHGLWQEHREEIARAFRVKGGRWVQLVLRETVLASRELLRRSKDHGRKAAIERWRKERERNENHARALPEQYPSNAGSITTGLQGDSTPPPLPPSPGSSSEHGPPRAAPRGGKGGGSHTSRKAEAAEARDATAELRNQLDDPDAEAQRVRDALGLEGDPA